MPRLRLSRNSAQGIQVQGKGCGPVQKERGTGQKVSGPGKKERRSGQKETVWP
jgi:hypothetical protein